MIGSREEATGRPARGTGVIPGVRRAGTDRDGVWMFGK